MVYCVYINIFIFNNIYYWVAYYVLELLVMVKGVAFSKHYLAGQSEHIAVLEGGASETGTKQR